MKNKVRASENRLYTVEQVARKLVVSMDYVRLNIRQGNISGIKIGNSHRVSEEEMQRIMRDGVKAQKIQPNTDSYGRSKKRGIIT